VSKLAITFKLKSVIFCFCSAVLITCLSLAAYYSGAYAVYFGGTTRLLPIYSVEREDKVVAISFDCAWGTDHTDDILNALRIGDVQATFFMVEFWTEDR
jgi:peptidoglycan/xylan/chitin deacetylase (PgdA/CDA1 family)